MSINTDSESSKADSPADSSSPAKIDFAKYRSNELVDSVAELISVPGRFLRVVRTAAFTIVLAAVGCYLIRTYSELSLIPLLLVSAYSLGMSVYFGASLGILRVISNALQNIDSILQIVLNKTVEVAQDYEGVRRGEQEFPTSGELVEQVYREVLVPVLERAVARSFRFLARPILWCLRRTLGAAVHRIVRRVNRSLSSQKQQQKTAARLETDAEPDGSDIQRVTTFTNRASIIAAQLGRRLRTFVMLPLYIALGISLTLAAIPVVVVVYYLG